MAKSLRLKFQKNRTKLICFIILINDTLFMFYMAFTDELVKRKKAFSITWAYSWQERAFLCTDLSPWTRLTGDQSRLWHFQDKNVTTSRKRGAVDGCVHSSLLQLTSQAALLFFFFFFIKNHLRYDKTGFTKRWHFPWLLRGKGCFCASYESKSLFLPTRGEASALWAFIEGLQ